MNFDETFTDKLLNITTEGRDESYSDDQNYPYEPTPYSVLERLKDSGLISAESSVIDFGCGKGRTCFYLSEKTGCKCLGVEAFELFYATAMANLEGKDISVSFENVPAEEFNIPFEADSMYFFNPFSVDILKKVVDNIVESYYENPRDIKLFFYYPSDEYVSYLMGVGELMFYDEIDCNDLFEEDTDRNRIMIWEF